ncbi:MULTISPECIES: hypothetical protein [unclassified Aeromicrobium]|uniref:hypothetical protein n=1 Tax=unclassified Aeromicrobium TaxID=2633570 RepID=UPI00288C209D|nr:MULTISPECIES: hypothetical protein [unclassified Aeromicrobium]
MSTLVHQLVLASPDRGDGHDVTGEPGDCWRTCIANMLGVHPSTVPNFVRYRSWMDEARRWLRARGYDYGYVIGGVEGLRNLRDDLDEGAWFIVTGPSPRGPWRHCVLMDRDLQLVHDPHPSGLGIITDDETEVEVELVQEGLFDRAPQPMPMLTATSRRTAA